MTKEEIIAAVKECAARLGHAPSLAEFRRNTKISQKQIQKHFGTYMRMLAAGGVERHGPGYVVSLQSLFMDWAGVARTLGRLPTIADYALHGKYSIRPLVRRFRTRRQAPAGLQDYARREGLEGEWHDVLEMIADDAQRTKKRPGTSGPVDRIPPRPRVLTNQPTYGRPLHFPLTHAPTNENGVIFVFGTVAHELGFSVLRIQAEFPDCEAMREVERNRWQRVRIEFEYESRNFLTHMHPAADCDLIVCWNHNWPDCPVEVLELRSMLENSRNHEAAAVQPETPNAPSAIAQEARTQQAQEPGARTELR